MKTHSPGPWTAISTDRGVLIDSAPAMIAKVPFTGEQAEADGRLIAAAPDLLALVVENVNFAEFAQRGKQPSDWLIKARAVIAKATGSTS